MHLICDILAHRIARTVFAELVALGHCIFKPFLKPKPTENPSRFHVLPLPFEKDPFRGSHYFGGNY